MTRVLGAAAAILFGIGSISFADEPVQEKSKGEKSFTAPAPHPATVEIVPYYLPPPLPRPGTREVWQYYGVDSRGRWVPRVMQSPYGNYYLYNGAPFPFSSLQRNSYMPYVVD